MDFSRLLNATSKPIPSKPATPSWPQMSSMEALLGAAAAAQNDLTDEDGEGTVVTEDAVAEREETPPAPAESQGNSIRGKRDWDATDSEPDEETRKPKKRAPPKKSSSTKPSRTHTISPSRSSSPHHSSPPPHDPGEEVEDEEDDDDQALYCTCRKPQGKRWMIQCDGCDDWFHGTCVKINEVDEGLIDKWYCPGCEEYKGRTTWKRKCRLGGCRKPADVGESEEGRQGGGKYCSKVHGVAFMKSIIQKSLLPTTELKALLISASTPTEFRTLGDRAPSPPPLLDSPDTATEDDREDIRVYWSEIERISEMRARVQEILERCAKRRGLLRYARDRAKKVSEDLRAEDSGVKDICGFDPRLIMCDSEFAAFTQTELGASIISPSSDTTPEDKVELCQMEKKKCARHMSWQQIRQEEIELEEALVREEMKCLQREEEKVRGVVVRRGIVAMEGQREGEVILASDRRDDGSALGEDKREEEEVVEVESPVTANSLHDAVVEPVATPAYSTADAVGEPEVSTTEGTPSATPVLEASAPAPDVSTKTEVEMDDVEGVSAEVQGGEE